MKNYIFGHGKVSIGKLVDRDDTIVLSDIFGKAGIVGKEFNDDKEIGNHTVLQFDNLGGLRTLKRYLDEVERHLMEKEGWNETH